MRITIHQGLWWTSKPAVFVYRVPHLLFVGPIVSVGLYFLFNLTGVQKGLFLKKKQFPPQKKYQGSLTWWKSRTHLFKFNNRYKMHYNSRMKKSWILFASNFRSRTLTKQPPARKKSPSHNSTVGTFIVPLKDAENAAVLETHRVRSLPFFPRDGESLGTP